MNIKSGDVLGEGCIYRGVNHYGPASDEKEEG